MSSSAAAGTLTGHEFRALRERAGLSAGEVAARAGVPERDVDAWEGGSGLPRRVRRTLDRALWLLERDAVLARPDAPRCADLDLCALPRRMNRAAREALVLHLQTCEACIARQPYLERHLRPEPGALSGWTGSALAGAAAMLLMMGALPLVLVLGMAIVLGEPWWIAGVIALPVVVAIGGGAGGVVHYVTRGWRGRGGIGHYGSWILVINTYVAAVVGMGAAGWMLAGAPADSEVAAMVADPIFWPIMLLTGIGWGIVLGWLDRPDARPSTPP